MSRPVPSGRASPGTADPSAAKPWHAGLRSVRALLYPGLFLQASAAGLVLAYYFLPPASLAFARVAAWQAQGGFAFSAASTALCGGLLPFLFLRFHPDTRATHPWPHVLFFTLYWAWKGAEIDLWYRSLALVHGHDQAAGTVAAKMATDQFLFNPLYAAPVGCLFFAWKDAGFRLAPVRDDLRAGRWYSRRVVPVLCATWFLWIPVTTCIYALPGALQMPLFNVVLCFWSMLFAHLTTRQNRGRTV